MNTYKLDIHYDIRCQNINVPSKDSLNNEKKVKL